MRFLLALVVALAIASAASALPRPPHYSQWMCIYRYENGGQGWRAIDKSRTYFGGLQMDEDFMSTYAPRLRRVKGTADRWTPLEQMWAAERAFSGIPGKVKPRGFNPWPNTARYCGLL